MFFNVTTFFKRRVPVCATIDKAVMGDNVGLYYITSPEPSTFNEGTYQSTFKHDDQHIEYSNDIPSTSQIPLLSTLPDPSEASNDVINIFMPIVVCLAFIRRVYQLVRSLDDRIEINNLILQWYTALRIEIDLRACAIQLRGLVERPQNPYLDFLEYEWLEILDEVSRYEALVKGDVIRQGGVPIDKVESPLVYESLGSLQNMIAVTMGSLSVGYREKARRKGKGSEGGHTRGASKIRTKSGTDFRKVYKRDSLMNIKIESGTFSCEVWRPQTDDYPNPEDLEKLKGPYPNDLPDSEPLILEPGNANWSEEIAPVPFVKLYGSHNEIAIPELGRQPSPSPSARARFNIEDDYESTLDEVTIQKAMKATSGSKPIISILRKPVAGSTFLEILTPVVSNESALQVASSSQGKLGRSASSLVRQTDRFRPGASGSKFVEHLIPVLSEEEALKLLGPQPGDFPVPSASFKSTRSSRRKEHRRTIGKRIVNQAAVPRPSARFSFCASSDVQGSNENCRIRVSTEHESRNTQEFSLVSIPDPNALGDEDAHSILKERFPLLFMGRRKAESTRRISDAELAPYLDRARSMKPQARREEDAFLPESHFSNQHQARMKATRERAIQRSMASFAGHSVEVSVDLSVTARPSASSTKSSRRRSRIPVMSKTGIAPSSPSLAMTHSSTPADGASLRPATRLRLPSPRSTWAYALATSSIQVASSILPAPGPPPALPLPPIPSTSLRQMIQASRRRHHRVESPRKLPTASTSSILPLSSSQSPKSPQPPSKNFKSRPPRPSKSRKENIRPTWK
ncbi:hypothetical protein BDN72DRAFT_881621 [Pluteus cervinus]|uniref:Uncharacterized protein n=1 Tax=Pluteus cervinus TaxID=181527 RepID=A0ACD3AF74_9AGAR|nr:hypothetical protein BDN72DRAFT_881621 [Pluteus cervinus]